MPAAGKFFFTILLRFVRKLALFKFFSHGVWPSLSVRSWDHPNVFRTSGPVFSDVSTAVFETKFVKNVSSDLSETAKLYFQNCYNLLVYTCTQAAMTSHFIPEREKYVGSSDVTHCEFCACVVYTYRRKLAIVHRLSLRRSVSGDVP